MNSNLTLNNNTDKIPQLFNGTIPGSILVNEFMDLRFKFNKEDKIFVELINENIYCWRIKFTNFSNKKLSKSLNLVHSLYGYDHIEIEIQLHDKLYPSYPPFIRVIKPRLSEMLPKRITNLKMVQLEYWSPSRGIEYVISKLYSILETHGNIDEYNVMNNSIYNKEESFNKLEENLIKVASMCNIKDDDDYLDTTDYPKFYNKKEDGSPSSNKYWKSGTGFGHSGASKWDIEKHIALQNENDAQRQNILQILINEIQNFEYEKLPYVFSIIESSYLIPFIKSYFQGTTLMEINKHKTIYELILTLLQYLATDAAIFLFDDKYNDKNLFTLFDELVDEAKQVLKFSKENQDKDTDLNDTEETDIGLPYMIISLFEMIEPTFKNYKEEQDKIIIKNEKICDGDGNRNSSNNNEHNNLSIHAKYVEELNKLKFKMDQFNFAPDGTFRYCPDSIQSDVSSSVSKNMIRRLAREFTSLIKSLPIFYQSSIFVRIDETNNRLIKVLITGPNDSPYDSGIYIFNVYISDNYPNGPPKMIHINNGGKRFNPNLYANGKVCLSLLGTWSGSGGEVWNSSTSTLQQLFVSTQSQILIDTPIFNEPGHESDIGTSNGDNKNKKYNQYIRYYNMCHSMVDMIKKNDSYPEFKEVIMKHFLLKKDYILTVCKKWVDEAISIDSSLQHNGLLNKEVMEDKYNELEKILNTI
jgi:ubiquitin-protein ligase